MMPGVIAGASFVLITSFDEVVIALFISDRIPNASDAHVVWPALRDRSNHRRNFKSSDCSQP
jgi:hypothetical protein